MNNKKAYQSPATEITVAAPCNIIAESIQVGGYTDATAPNEVKENITWDIWED